MRGRRGLRVGGAVGRRRDPPVHPDGTLDRVVALPVRRPTSCAFGGPGLTDLYVTTARVAPGGPAHPLDGSLLVLPDAGREWRSPRSRAEGRMGRRPTFAATGKLRCVHLCGLAQDPHTLRFLVSPQVT
ncbi:SMP-30/gluconolactonase/LRE family protein [Streptomyces sp. M19]